MVFFVEIKEVRRVGALETVNGLVVVAHSHNVWLTFIAWVVREEADELQLCVVCILVLVEQNILEAFLGIIARFVVVCEQIDGV